MIISVTNLLFSLFCSPSLSTLNSVFCYRDYILCYFFDFLGNSKCISIRLHIILILNLWQTIWIYAIWIIFLFSQSDIFLNLSFNWSFAQIYLNWFRALCITHQFLIMIAYNIRKLHAWINLTFIFGNNISNVTLS